MEHAIEQPAAPRRINVRTLILGSVAVLLIALLLVGGAAWAWSRANVLRFGQSLLVGPAATGDHWLDGGNTQVTVSSVSIGERSILIRHAFRSGELLIWQVTHTRSRRARNWPPLVERGSATAGSLGGYLLIHEYNGDHSGGVGKRGFPTPPLSSTASEAHSSTVPIAPTEILHCVSLRSE